jgi:carbon storage regulator CsrA
MRVMTREVNQGVIIGENVHVQVLEIRGNAVRLGISHPRAESPSLYDYREETLSIEELPDGLTEPLETVR